MLRDAWDHGDLRTLTKNDPVKATGAHVSLIGHITKFELGKYLSDTEIFNGFGNRILWICTKRSKLLPLGGKPDEWILAEIKKCLSSTIEYAAQRGLVPLGHDTKELYTRLYSDLANERPGLIGTLIARAEPLILRLALLYALLDCCETVKPEHLKAGVAVFQYAEQSVENIFGRSTGDKTADKIIVELSSRPEGMTQSQILIEIFQGHVRSQQINQSLQMLVRYGLVHFIKEQGSNTKSVIRWFMLLN